MILKKAIEVFQISSDIIPTDEYLKKRYRFIASKIHPDKFTNPREKLIAHQDFLELQDAYELLLSVNVNERCSEVNYTDSSIKNEVDKPKNDYESYYVQKKRPYDWLYIILIPGVMINMMFWSIPMAIILFFDLDVKSKSNNNVRYIKNVTLYLVFGAIPMLFAFAVIIYLVYEKIKKGDWFWWFILIEILLANLYFGVSYLKRKFFLRKIKTNLIFKE